MKILTALYLENDSILRVQGMFGVVKITPAFSKMLLSRKLLMELAGALYTDHFVMEFTEQSLQVNQNLKEQFLTHASLFGSNGWVETYDLPEPGKLVETGHSVLRLTQDGFWWVLDAQTSLGGDAITECYGVLHVQTAKLPWSLVFDVVGKEFDPKKTVSEGSYLVHHWEEE